MTGAEVLIRHGDDFLLGKVRHTGGDFLGDFIPNGGTPRQGESRGDYWQRYLEHRRKAFTPVDLASEIETAFDGGLLFKPRRQVQFTVPSAEEFDALVREAEALLPPEDGYTCGYGDYRVYVDLGASAVFRITEGGAESQEVEEPKEVDLEEMKHLYLHCAQCLKERPEDQAPREWGRNEVSISEDGKYLLVNCVRHERPVAVADITGVYGVS